MDGRRHPTPLGGHKRRTYNVTLNVVQKDSGVCAYAAWVQFEAEFKGDKAKLYWPTSLDGKKTESETYKIIAVMKAKQ